MMMKTMGLVVGLAVGLLTPALGKAAFQTNPPGFVDAIACGRSGTTFWPRHYNNSNYNNFTNISFDTRVTWPVVPGQSRWWSTYANEADGSWCSDWVRGLSAGGAGFTSGVPSVPRGRNVSIRAYWRDSQPTTREQCVHHHLFNYVWGWRYTGSSWINEFYSSTAMTSYWYANGGFCMMKGDGNDQFDGAAGFAYGDGTVRIPNSPYAAMYWAARAESHVAAGCGTHGCFHDVSVAVSY